jgi:hypothetical protein
MKTGRGQALSWRLTRQFLAEGAASADRVVERLGAMPAVSGDAELAVRRRLTSSAAGEVARALESGRVMKTYLFRGATHLVSPRVAGGYLALRAAGRQWELPSWVRHYGVGPRQWPALRGIVRDLVADGPVTREQLAAGVTRDARFGRLGPAFTDNSDTFLKPFAWQGDICFGPVRDGRATFQSPSVSPLWSGIPDLDDAGRASVAAYFDAYGPATAENLYYWLGNGLSAGRKRIARWLAELSDELAEITVDGRPMLQARRHLDALAAASPSAPVVLLPGHDQWVLGPGTADGTIVPGKRRAAVSRGANLVVADGVVIGTWKAGPDTLAVSWFAEAGDAPRADIESEARRLAALLGRDLAVSHA